MASIPTHPLGVPSAYRKLSTNSVWLLINRLVAQGQAFILAILVARGLGEAAFGQYSLIAALIAAGNVITTFGTDTYLTRQVAGANRADIEEVSGAAGLQIALSVGFVSLVWLGIGFFPDRSIEYQWALRIYALSLFPQAITSVSSATLRGLERMDLYLASSLGTAAVQLAVVLFVFVLRGDLRVLMSGLLLVQVCGMLFSYLLCKKAAREFKLLKIASLQRVISLLRLAWPLAALSILGVIYLRLGIFALSVLGSDAQTGQFAAASRIVEALKLGHIAVLGALLPALSSHRAEDLPRTNPERYFGLAVWGLLGLGLLGAGSAYLFGSPLVRLLYGEGFSAATATLRTLALGLVPYSLSAAFSVHLVANGRETWVMAALLVSLAAAAGLSAWWIPLQGATGAGAALVVAETIQAGVLWALHKKVR